MSGAPSTEPSREKPGTATGTDTRGPLRIFIVAGEASGDSHGAALVRALRELEPGVQISGLGGPALMAEGVPSPMDFVAHATMGVIPVLRKLPFFRKALREAGEALERERPHVLVPIDYPGFNLRLARRARELGIFVAYYVSPQVWAWGPWRIKKIVRAIDHMLCLFPFEKDLYERQGVPVTHVGHPIFDALRAEPRQSGFRETVGIGSEDPIVALLPGSRAQEISQNLPGMLDAARRIHAHAATPKETQEIRFVVPCAQASLRPLVDAVVSEKGAGLPVSVVDGLAREVARRAKVAIVTSGTATLELLFHEVPMVVVYRVNQLKYSLVRKFLLTVQHVSLVNILAGREVVPEFVGEFQDDSVALACLELLREGRARKQCLAKLRNLKSEVGAPGASERAARVVLACARERAART